MAKARVLARDLYTMTTRGGLGRDWGLANQLQRAGASVMANIAEGFERNSRSEFHQFLSTAKGSCAEVRSHLYLALDAGYIEPAEFRKLLSQAEEVGRLVGGLRASVQKRAQAGFPKARNGEVNEPSRQGLAEDSRDVSC